MSRGVEAPADSESAVCVSVHAPRAARAHGLRLVDHQVLRPFVAILEMKGADVAQFAMRGIAAVEGAFDKQTEELGEGLRVLMQALWHRRV